MAAFQLMICKTPRGRRQRSRSISEMATLGRALRTTNVIDNTLRTLLTFHVESVSRLFKKKINLRLLLVCIAAAAVALPIAIISIAKLLLLIGGLVFLLTGEREYAPQSSPRTFRRTDIAVIVCLIAMALSLLWTTATQAEATSSMGKYGKLLIIPIIASLIRSRSEAKYALSVFILAQLFLLISSWMLFFNFPVPWATAASALVQHAPFSSYLDEGIMTATVGILCWHFRTLAGGRKAQIAMILLAVLAFANVFFVLDGRTGHVVAIVLLSLAVMWELPSKARISVLVLPFILLLGISLLSPKVRHRMEMVKDEVRAFSHGTGQNVITGTSSGMRLNFWQRSIQSIAEKPLKGSGIGSWSNEFNRVEMENEVQPQKLAPMGNPHHEYLLWGVQLGLPGIGLFIFLLASLLHDTVGMEKNAARAARSMLTALAVACLFNSTLYDAQIGDFFCVGLGLLLAMGAYSSEPAAGTQGRIAQ
jgi:O-antigen ligase